MNHRRGCIKALRRLQKLLMKSWAAKCLAVRREQRNHFKTGQTLTGSSSRSVRTYARPLDIAYRV
ncbi:MULTISPECIES: reverse transcriptase N-terminal domain-containing protein [unclassified Microcoleus]|uniref:reverse transcriptase N-terminal domain-containing protein n=1 Tax=unclassified Microcoleus TaxID=2642155 RepID=UPI002FD34A31